MSASVRSRRAGRAGRLHHGRRLHDPRRGVPDAAGHPAHGEAVPIARGVPRRSEGAPSTTWRRGRQETEVTAMTQDRRDLRDEGSRPHTRREALRARRRGGTKQARAGGCSSGAPSSALRSSPASRRSATRACLPPPSGPLPTTPRVRPPGPLLSPTPATPARTPFAEGTCLPALRSGSEPLRRLPHLRAGALRRRVPGPARPLLPLHPGRVPARVRRLSGRPFARVGDPLGG